MSEKTISLLKPYDLHVHVRQADLLLAVLKYTLQQCAGALVMPNTKPPIRTAEDALRYRDEILAIAEKAGYTNFILLLTIYLTGATTPEMIMDAARAGVRAVKVYPLNGTTNSQDGIANLLAPELSDVIHAIKESGMKLSIHGEVPHPGVEIMDREFRFLDTLQKLTMQFPKLPIVLEHISSAEAVEVVEGLARTRGNIWATITAHHPWLTLNDVLGSGIEAAHYCYPIVKTSRDRLALWDAIHSRNPAFFLGSDSAPHLWGNKYCPKGAGGLFTAPILMPLLAHLFEKNFGGSWEKGLENFATRFGAQCYGLPIDDTQRITLVRKPYIIPKEIEGVPMPGVDDRTLNWSLAD